MGRGRGVGGRGAEALGGCAWGTCRAETTRGCALGGGAPTGPARMAGSSATWDAVDERLALIPPAFRQGDSFDPLPFVVEVIGSLEPDRAAENLRERVEEVDALVGDVVAANFGGFTRSIKHYSTIIRLLVRSEAAVSELGASVKGIRRGISQRNAGLASLWTRGVTNREALRLLAACDAMSRAPAAIRRLAREGRYREAVAQQLDASRELARAELRQIGALQAARAQVAQLGTILHDTMLVELIDRIFLAHGDSGSGDKGTLGRLADWEAHEEALRAQRVAEERARQLAEEEALTQSLAARRRGETGAPVTPGGRHRRNESFGNSRGAAPSTPMYSESFGGFLSTPMRTDVRPTGGRQGAVVPPPSTRGTSMREGRRSPDPASQFAGLNERAAAAEAEAHVHREGTLPVQDLATRPATVTSTPSMSKGQKYRRSAAWRATSVENEEQVRYLVVCLAQLGTLPAALITLRQKLERELSVLTFSLVAAAVVDVESGMLSPSNALQGEGDSLHVASNRAVQLLGRLFDSSLIVARNCRAAHEAAKIAGLSVAPGQPGDALFPDMLHVTQCVENEAQRLISTFLTDDGRNEGELPQIAPGAEPFAFTFDFSSASETAAGIAAGISEEALNSFRFRVEKGDAHGRDRLGAARVRDRVVGRELVDRFLPQRSPYLVVSLYADAVNFSRRLATIATGSAQEKESLANDRNVMVLNEALGGGQIITFLRKFADGTFSRRLREDLHRYALRSLKDDAAYDTPPQEGDHRNLSESIFAMPESPTELNDIDILGNDKSKGGVRALEKLLETSSIVGSALVCVLDCPALLVNINSEEIRHGCRALSPLAELVRKCIAYTYALPFHCPRLICGLDRLKSAFALGCDAVFDKCVRGKLCANVLSNHPELYAGILASRSFKDMDRQIAELSGCMPVGGTWMSRVWTPVDAAASLRLAEKWVAWPPYDVDRSALFGSKDRALRSRLQRIACTGLSLVGYLQRIAHAIMGDMETLSGSRSRAAQLKETVGTDFSPGEIFFHEYSSTLSLFAQRISRIYSRCILALAIDLRVRIALELKTLLNGLLASDNSNSPITAKEIAAPFLVALAEFCDTTDEHPLWLPAFNFILGGVERQISVSLLKIIEEKCGLDGHENAGDGIGGKHDLATWVVRAAELIDEFFAPYRRRAVEKFADSACDRDKGAKVHGEIPYDVSMAAKVGYSGGLEDVRALYNMLYAQPE